MIPISKKITIDKQVFEFVKKRTYEPSYQIYRSPGAILRIGPRKIICKELQTQRELHACNFPVARVVSEGTIGDREYFIEEKMGDKHFGQLFSEDMQNYGFIRKSTFHGFLNVVKKYVSAQLKNKDKPNSKMIENFVKACYLYDAQDELHGRIKAFPDIINKVRTAVKNQPFVLTHGDFNPHNIYPNGVIDLEGFAAGPLGYDLVSAIESIHFFPLGGDYEMFANYQFSSDQKELFYEEMEELLRDRECDVSTMKLCRASFSVVKMHHMPNIQALRYKMFERIAMLYLGSEEIHLRTMLAEITRLD